MPGSKANRSEHMKRATVLICVLAAWGAAAATARAQVDRATLTGTVKDPTGAVIPNAAVSITGPQAPASTRTNAEGVYLVTSLVPGPYVVEAEAPRLPKSGQ